MLTLSEETTPIEKRANNPEKIKTKYMNVGSEKKPYSDKKIENMLMNIWCFCAFFALTFWHINFPTKMFLYICKSPTQRYISPICFWVYVCVECMTSDSRWWPTVHSRHTHKKMKSPMLFVSDYEILWYRLLFIRFHRFVWECIFKFHIEPPNNNCDKNLIQYS